MAASPPLISNLKFTSHVASWEGDNSEILTRLLKINTAYILTF